MIFFKIGVILLFIVNVLLLFLPNNKILKSLAHKKQQNVIKLVTFILYVMALSVMFGMLGGLIYLTPLLFTQDEDWGKLIMPIIYLVLFVVVYIRLIKSGWVKKMG